MIGISDLEYLCAEVRQIARKAGAFLRDERQKFDRERVEEKSAHNYVSYVDKESERRLVEQLSTLLPEAGFIAEEGSGSLTDEEYCWVIDPLDGTSNYIHDMAPYSVSIALRDREELLLGVVYEVCRNECFYAWKDGGAYLNGVRISASPVTSIGTAYIHLGLPYDAEKYRTFSTAMLSRFYGHVGGVRIAGSAAMDICGVAAGRTEAYIEPSLHLWDVAAGILILREAGGIVSDFEGSSLLYGATAGDSLRVDGYDVVATNSGLHADVLSYLYDCL